MRLVSATLDGVEVRLVVEEEDLGDAVELVLGIGRSLVRVEPWSEGVAVLQSRPGRAMAMTLAAEIVRRRAHKSPASSSAAAASAARTRV